MLVIHFLLMGILVIEFPLETQKLVTQRNPVSIKTETKKEERKGKERKGRKAKENPSPTGIPQ